MSLRILPPEWSLQPFEAEMARLELAAVAGGTSQWVDGVLSVQACESPEVVDALRLRLGLSRAVVGQRGQESTFQHLLEASAGGGRRKSTSHALHGLHAYKGKFYPQLARALLNICGVRAGERVLDPFAGCGTTLLEAAFLGASGVGVDANPLAALVAATKLRLLRAVPKNLALRLKEVESYDGETSHLPDEDYMARWFPATNLADLRRLIGGVDSLPRGVARDAAKVLLSSVLRECSMQDPAQLRVYRRRDGQVPRLAERFAMAAENLVRDLGALKAILKESRVAPSRDVEVIHGDSRNLCRLLEPGSISAIVTSPPYANALPYIDTDRLSLRALGLLPPGGQRVAEQRLIGNREVSDRDVRSTEVLLRDALASSTWLPDELRVVLRKTTIVAAQDTSGFRRRRTPALLYSYFRDMRQVLEGAAVVLQSGAPVAMVVGDNTVMGPTGEPLVVPTTRILTEIAGQSGLELEQQYSKRLTSFGASTTVHQRNAMAEEQVLLFRNS
jgi:hypothetical protein